MKHTPSLILRLLDVAKLETTDGGHLLRAVAPGTRPGIIRKAAAAIAAPVNSVRRWFCKWLSRGMCKAALIPDVISMSGAGKTRDVPLEACDSLGNPLDPSLHPKPGRRSGPGTRLGTRMTASVRNSILTVGREIYLTSHTFSVGDAYVEWKQRMKDVAPHRYPTPQAFYAVLKKDPTVKATIKIRGLCGRKPRGGAAEQEPMHARVPGPGFCFQGDSTPLSRIKVDGKTPTLYFSSDTFSSGITGYYLYKGKPSAAAHSRCLAHAATDKVAYCARFGITILPHQWPHHVVPERWVADRGELIGPIADLLVSEFDTTLSNTPAYSPQLKADVEAAFGALLRSLISKLDSHVPPRPGRKFGDTINLTMQELHVLIILFVLAYNSRKIPQVPTPSQTKRSVPMTPLGLWNKEVDRYLGEGRTYSQDELHLMTTERAKATMDESGLLFKGLAYDCPEAGVAAFQSQLGPRRKTFVIHYDEDRTDEIHIQRRVLSKAGVQTEGPAHSFIVCPLSGKDSEWAGYTFPEFEAAYATHTEATHPLYDEHDAIRGVMVATIGSLNQSKPQTPSDAPDTNPDAVSPPTTPEGATTTELPAKTTPPQAAKPVATISGAELQSLKELRNRAKPAQSA